MDYISYAIVTVAVSDQVSDTVIFCYAMAYYTILVKKILLNTLTLL